MRFTGKLTIWHDDRGFGFITPDEGGQDIFLHISELPRGVRPAVGQAFGFEVALNARGKKKATGVYVQAAGPVRARPAPSRVTRKSPASGNGAIGTVMAFLVLCAIVYGTYLYQVSRRSADAAPEQAGSACDGRRFCSQMTSCKEAKYFLAHCPGVQMDGNSDGIPCEKQWCTGPVERLFR